MFLEDTIKVYSYERKEGILNGVVKDVDDMQQHLKVNALCLRIFRIFNFRMKIHILECPTFMPLFPNTKAIRPTIQ